MLQNYLRPPKSATAADIVIGPAMKTLKGTSHTLGKNVITGVIDTGDKLFAGVNDSTGDKLY